MEHADVHLDVQELPSGAKSFDVVFCYQVTSLVPDDIQAMEEIRRVLKPGGWAIIQNSIHMGLTDTVPIIDDDSPLTRDHFGVERKITYSSDGLRLYGQDYETRLERGGFTTSKLPYTNKLETDEILRYGINEFEDLYIGYR